MTSAYTAVKNFITFIIIGIGSMLPGLSGATLAVVFGVYERLIRDLAKLRVYLIKDIKFIIVVLLGFALGTLICAKVLNHALDDYPVECLMFFIGLIIGQIPLLVRTANQDAKTSRKGLFGKDCCIAFAVGLAVTLLMIVLDAVGQTGDVTIEHNATGFIIMIGVGVIFAISAILPGLSHSTVLLVLGLMSTFTAAISDLDFFLLTPILLAYDATRSSTRFSTCNTNLIHTFHLTFLLIRLVRIGRPIRPRTSLQGGSLCALDHVRIYIQLYI
ncbi:transmembrane protein [methanogenic archaeon ISO4-H5]|nr:transmembrane protein [methanogenic archaeon ISO4-H5]